MSVFRYESTKRVSSTSTDWSMDQSMSIKSDLPIFIDLSIDKSIPIFIDWQLQAQ